MDSWTPRRADRRSSNEENIPPSHERTSQESDRESSETSDDHESSETSSEDPFDLSFLQVQLPSTRPIPDFLRAPVANMNKDSQFTYVHMHSSVTAEMFEDFCKDKLPDDDIFVPAHLQPINPEEEDDVVPDQHAAFGIEKATQKTKEPVWKDLGLSDLMTKGPGSGPSRAAGGARRKKRVQGGASQSSGGDGGGRSLPR